MENRYSWIFQHYLYCDSSKPARSNLKFEFYKFIVIVELPIIRVVSLRWNGRNWNIYHNEHVRDGTMFLLKERICQHFYIKIIAPTKASLSRLYSSTSSFNPTKKYSLYV